MRRFGTQGPVHPERNYVVSRAAELATYGVIKEGTDGMCEILNPIYFYCILREFKPIANGLEQEYFRQEVRDEFQNYLTSTEETE